MNKEQRKLLKKIKKRKLFPRLEISESEIETLFYLQRNRFVAPKGIPNDKKQYFVITEEGKAELHDKRAKAFATWVPIIISLIALICTITHITLDILGIT